MRIPLIVLSTMMLAACTDSATLLSADTTAATATYTRSGNASCTYTGTFVGNPPISVNGTMTCVLAVDGQNHRFSGVWQGAK